MTAQSIVCGACAAEVPYGRLSCPSCGELLASVAGSRRSAASAAASVAARPSPPDVAPEPPAAAGGTVSDGRLSLDGSARDAETGPSWDASTATHAAAAAVEATVEEGDASANGLLDDDADGLPPWTPPSTTVPWGTASDLNGRRTPAYMPRPGLRPAASPATASLAPQTSVTQDSSTWDADDREPAPAGDPDPGLHGDLEPVNLSDLEAVPVSDLEPAPRVDADLALVGGSEPAPAAEPDLDLVFPPGPPVAQQPDHAVTPEPEVSWPEPGSVSWPTRGPVAWPEPAVAALAAAPPPSPEDTLPAGPAVSLPTAPTMSRQPMEAFAGPGAYLPPVPVAVPAGPSAPAREWAGQPAEADERSDPPATHDARPLIDGDVRTRLLEFVKWLSVAGAAFAAVGFLLPWGQVVIGSADTGYFGRWGIAGPWHLLVALAILADLGLALIDNKVPIWIRTGLAGLGLGALLVGLVWPYLTLPSLGAGPGAVIAGIGATALVVSGIIALVADRHVEAAKPV